MYVYFLYYLCFDANNCIVFAQIHALLLFCTHRYFVRIKLMRNEGEVSSSFSFLNVHNKEDARFVKNASTCCVDKRRARPERYYYRLRTCSVFDTSHYLVIHVIDQLVTR